MMLSSLLFSIRFQVVGLLYYCCLCEGSIESNHLIMGCSDAIDVNVMTPSRWTYK